jgi:hypothetical protein
MAATTMARVRRTRISLDSSRSYGLAARGPSINRAEYLRDRRGDRCQRHSRIGILRIPWFFAAAGAGTLVYIVTLAAFNWIVNSEGR